MAKLTPQLLIQQTEVLAGHLKTVHNLSRKLHEADRSGEFEQRLVILRELQELAPLVKGAAEDMAGVFSTATA